MKHKTTTATHVGISFSDFEEIEIAANFNEKAADKIADRIAFLLIKEGFFEDAPFAFINLYNSHDGGYGFWRIASYRTGQPVFEEEQDETPDTIIMDDRTKDIARMIISAIEKSPRIAFKPYYGDEAVSPTYAIVLTAK